MWLIKMGGSRGSSADVERERRASTTQNTKISLKTSHGRRRTGDSTTFHAAMLRRESTPTILNPQIEGTLLVVQNELADGVTLKVGGWEIRRKEGGGKTVHDLPFVSARNLHRSAFTRLLNSGQDARIQRGQQKKKTPFRRSYGEILGAFSLDVGSRSSENPRNCFQSQLEGGCRFYFEWSLKIGHFIFGMEMVQYNLERRKPVRKWVYKRSLSSKSFSMFPSTPKIFPGRETELEDIMNNLDHHPQWVWYRRTIEQARQWIFEKGYLVAGAAVNRLLKPKSLAAKTRRDRRSLGNILW
ncbi:hypothetical protein B0H14DRAFT_3130068 [Mycena olivaceomarginata]|nr:hypothetical protein B0H14DRAFT_3130068 [Mycena olivaceomarginata]